MSESGAAGVRALVLDIEGTTTPVAFVYEVLFPYARSHLRSHIERHASDPAYDRLFERLRAEHASDGSAEGLPPWVSSAPSQRLASVAAYVEWLMDRDRKSPALKELQGLIWEEGYRRGALVGQVFPDVPRAFERWNARQLQLAIFSSGSVLGQQLLFRHSSAGDLTRFISRYFDTSTGPKSSAESYERIAAALKVPPAHCLFASDAVGELDAARAAGMQTRLTARLANAPPPAHAHAVIQSFDELLSE